MKVGDYIGQNYGKITKISETDISLREIVQDAAGEWIERTGALQLQDPRRRKRPLHRRGERERARASGIELMIERRDDLYFRALRSAGVEISGEGLIAREPG